MRRKPIAHSSTDRIPRSEFSLLTLIGTAFPRTNEVCAHLCLGSKQIAQWIVGAAAALVLPCMRVLIHQQCSWSVCAHRRGLQACSDKLAP